MNAFIPTHWNVLGENEPEHGWRALVWMWGEETPVKAAWDQGGVWHVEERDEHGPFRTEHVAHTTDLWTYADGHPLAGTPAQPVRAPVRQEVDLEVFKRFEDVLRRNLMPRIAALEQRSDI